ncbi:hypothetical protein HZB74_02215 [Candidatus Saccharibacteria bacterium]|nr:hypothetical protein [Candidatus Saccharibacteria bacterium]
MFNIGALLDRVRLSVYWLLAMALAVSGLAPVFLLGDTAGAATLDSRKVTISTSRSAATAVQYDFEFDWANTTDVEGIIFQFCTTPLGTCNLPNGMDVSNDLVTLDGHTGFPTNGTSFAEVASNTGDCSDTGSAATVTMYCINRTQAATGTGTNATVDLGAIINPTLGVGTCTSSVFCTVYVRVSLYPNNTFTASSSTNNGTVAAGITQQLTVNGRVQERLDFCVSAIDDGGAGDTTLPVGASDSCATIGQTTTTVDIGVIDDSGVQLAPVDTTATNGANDDYGIAMVKTNASGGVAVTFFAEPDAGAPDTDQERSFKVDNADCNAVAATFTDQCFRSAANGGTGTTIGAVGQEWFGVYVPCVDQGDGTRSTTSALTIDGDFDGFDATTARVADCENADKTDNSGLPTISWNDTSTATAIASSTGVVDDEVIKLSFAAQAASTTPTGFYTVVSTYIATPTF